MSIRNLSSNYAVSENISASTTVGITNLSGNFTLDDTSFFYTRIGNIVQFYGQFLITSSDNNDISFQFDLPEPIQPVFNFSDDLQVNGIGVWRGNVNYLQIVVGEKRLSLSVASGFTGEDRLIVTGSFFTV